MNHQCVQEAKRTNCTLGCIKHNITSLSKEVIVPLYSTLVLECCVQVWTSWDALVHLGLGEGFREALSSSPWYPVTEQVGLVQICLSRYSDFPL